MWPFQFAISCLASGHEKQAHHTTVVEDWFEHCQTLTFNMFSPHVNLYLLSKVFKSCSLGCWVILETYYGFATILRHLHESMLVCTQSSFRCRSNWVHETGGPVPCIQRENGQAWSGQQWTLLYKPWPPFHSHEKNGLCCKNNISVR